jgi:hypothetical protein
MTDGFLCLYLPMVHSARPAAYDQTSQLRKLRCPDYQVSALASVNCIGYIALIRDAASRLPSVIFNAATGIHIHQTVWGVDPTEPGRVQLKGKRMSYLSCPRIHFAGRFQADTSTVNNDVRHYDSELFVNDFQRIMKLKNQEIEKYNGYWNPEGSGAWRLLGCRVNSVVVDGDIKLLPSQDPAVGMLIGGSDDRVAGKLVDLDPQQQMVSQIWGLTVRLQSGEYVEAFSGNFAVAPFCDLWKRQQNTTQFLDQTLAAVYQSVLTDVVWSDNVADSPCLRALKKRSADGLLSIRMNVFGYDRTPYAADYTTGVAVGTIGPAEATGPRHFVIGRQLTAQLAQPPFVPANKIGNVQAVVDDANSVVTVDLGNALPTLDSAGTLEDVGKLVVGVLRDAATPQGNRVGLDGIDVLGAIPYQDEGWFFRTAGIIDFDFTANAAVKSRIGDHPLAVARQDPDGGYTVLNRETGDGVYVRADMFVYRLNAGESETIDFYASQYGQPLNTTITAQPTTGQSDFMGGAGTGAKLPADYAIPDVRVPPNVVQYDTSFETPGGHHALVISADKNGPGNPRKTLDGQLYGIAYQFKDLPPNYTSNPFNYISILAWDSYQVPEHPTWYQHVQPILRQYANLYPIMSRRLFDLADYDCVVANLAIMKLCFKLPVSDPNSMPVTRDLSDKKRECILKWLDEKDPQTGLPPKGEPADGAALKAVTPRLAEGPRQPEGPRHPQSTDRPEMPSSQADLGSKAEFLRQVRKHNQR